MMGKYECDDPDCFYCREMLRGHHDLSWNSFNLANYETEYLSIFKPMEKLKEKIRDSGLKQSYIAARIGVGQSHLTMMLNGNATMPEEIRNKINELLDKMPV